MGLWDRLLIWVSAVWYCRYCGATTITWRGQQPVGRCACPFHGTWQSVPRPEIRVAPARRAAAAFSHPPHWDVDEEDD